MRIAVAVLLLLAGCTTTSDYFPRLPGEWEYVHGPQAGQVSDAFVNETGLEPTMRNATIAYQEDRGTITVYAFRDAADAHAHFESIGCGDGLLHILFDEDIVVLIGALGEPSPDGLTALTEVRDRIAERTGARVIC